MGEVTHGQKHALEILKRLHDHNPRHGNFASVHVGINAAARLRKLAQQGYVSVTRGGRGSRQFFAITDSGRALLGDGA